ncbi:MAG: nitrilase-related carbon-nitrogen hydrolase [Caldilineaceae bacterium]
MERLVVASIQQRMRLPRDIDEYREDLRRFMRIAEKKNARLVVFPALAGSLTALPLLTDTRSRMVKRADVGQRVNASLWDKMAGSLAATMASALKVDLRRNLAGLLDVAAADVHAIYMELFSRLASEFSMTVVAPSAYLPDPLDGVLRNMAVVFGPGGETLGRQAQVVLSQRDEDIAQPGSSWEVIQTEVGRLGLMLGSDVLYPEVGRVLAYQGAEVLVSLGACIELVEYNKIRAGILARMQDNQLFGVTSFLVGRNSLYGRKRSDFMGKSAIFAPQELTPKLNGVLVEMGNYRSEGVLTAEWDFVALRNLWDTSETPIRQHLSLDQTREMLSQLYTRIRELPIFGENKALPAPANGFDNADDALAPPAHVEVRMMDLDDLPVLGSVTSVWPLPRRGHAGLSVVEDYDEVFEMQSFVARDAPAASKMAKPEDETEEMDALEE